MDNKETMNSFQRVMGVIEGKRPDITPIVPIVREWCSRQAGVEFLDELEKVEEHVYAQTFCLNQFSYDVVWGEAFACHSESEAMGSVLKLSKGYLPSVEKPAVNDYAVDLPKLKLFDPYQDKRLSVFLEQIRRLKTLFNGKVPVIGYVQAPFRHASMLRGSENIMRDMFKQKENLRALLELAYSTQIVYAVALISAGADILFVSDPTSSGNAISKKQWEEWGLPVTTKLIALIKRSGIKTILHICGNTEDRLESLASTGVDCLSLDEAVDFEKARQTLGPDYCLMGNVSTTLLATGRKEDVEEATREVIDKAGKEGHLLMSGGCLLAGNCPAENIQAMVTAAKEYTM